jgi:hypothetical protein
MFELICSVAIVKHSSFCNFRSAIACQRAKRTQRTSNGSNRLNDGLDQADFLDVRHLVVVRKVIDDPEQHIRRQLERRHREAYVQQQRVHVLPQLRTTTNKRYVTVKQHYTTSLRRIAFRFVRSIAPANGGSNQSRAQR